MRLRLGRPRSVGAGVVAAVAIGVVVTVGHGEPVQDVRVLSGAAWLASAKVGQVTLLDGTTAEVSAQVQVAAAGSALDVVQQGSTAFAVDQNAGTIRRIDGATFEATPPQAPIPDAHTGLTAVPGRTALYTLDTQRGILARTDPTTLARRGDLLPVADKLGAGTATVDDAGVFWAIDTSTGDLNRIDGQDRSVRRGLAPAGASMVTIVNGRPVVVGQTERKAMTVDKDNGRVTGTLDLDLRPNEAVQISGSPHSERLYVLAQRGVLDICDLAQGACDSAIPLTAGNEYGAAVETAGRLFVPDYSTGQVWIIDLGLHKVVAKPAVLTSSRFQLLARDGLVFYNDPGSEKAGVIHVDGTFTSAAKYDPADPSKGLTVSPGGGGATSTQQQQQSRSSQPPPSQSSQQSQQSQPSQKSSRPDDPAVPGAPTLQITMSDTSPTVNQPVVLRVENTSGSPVSQASWSFGDGESGTGPSTSHKWVAARDTPYQVSVIATTQDGLQATGSASVLVSSEPTVRLTVQVPGGGGTVTADGISCPGDCEADVRPDTALTLQATPAPGHLLGTWTGCASTTDKCDVTMTLDKTVSYTFGTAIPQAKLTVRSPVNGTITGGGISCPGTCSITVDKGTPVTLKATVTQPIAEFTGWGDACAGRPGDTCQLTLTGTETFASATFPEKPRFTLTLRSDQGPSFPPGNGDIHGTSPQDFVCTLPCDTAKTFHRDDQVTVVVRPAPPEDRPGGHKFLSSFIRWQGGPCDGSTQPTCSFRLTANVTMTALTAGVIPL
jgi:PKD domain-containing protein/List-Bact-rpt repeat protein